MFFSCSIIPLLFKNSLIDGLSVNRDAISNLKFDGLLNEFVVVLLNFNAGYQWREKSIRDSLLVTNAVQPMRKPIRRSSLVANILCPTRCSEILFV